MYPIDEYHSKWDDYGEIIDLKSFGKPADEFAIKKSAPTKVYEHFYLIIFLLIIIYI